jgi:hypothetical protein
MNEPETEAQASAGVIKIGAKKRRLQRACDICRRRKGECVKLVIISASNFLFSSLYVS